MKWFLRHMPQSAMDMMLKMMVVFPARVRRTLMVFMMRQMLALDDANIDSVVKKMTNGVFKLTPKQSEPFAETRLASIVMFPKDEAVRLVKPMAKACKEGPFKEYVREQAQIQRLILGMPKEQQMQIAEVFEAGDNTGFLPLEVTLERQKVQGSIPAKGDAIKKVCTVCNAPILVSEAAQPPADCPECGSKGAVR